MDYNYFWWYSVMSFELFAVFSLAHAVHLLIFVVRVVLFMNLSSKHKRIAVLLLPNKS